jgi:hypothetical protein
MDPNRFCKFSAVDTCTTPQVYVPLETVPPASGGPFGLVLVLHRSDMRALSGPELVTFGGSSLCGVLFAEQTPDNLTQNGRNAVDEISYGRIDLVTHNPFLIDSTTCSLGALPREQSKQSPWDLDTVFFHSFVAVVFARCVCAPGRPCSFAQPCIGTLCDAGAVPRHDGITWECARSASGSVQGSCRVSPTAPVSIAKAAASGLIQLEFSSKRGPV